MANLCRYFLIVDGKPQSADINIVYMAGVSGIAYKRILSYLVSACESKVSAGKDYRVGNFGVFKGYAASYGIGRHLSRKCISTCDKTLYRHRFIECEDQNAFVLARSLSNRNANSIKRRLLAISGRHDGTIVSEIAVYGRPIGYGL